MTPVAPLVFCDDVRAVCDDTPPCCSSCHDGEDEGYAEFGGLLGDHAHGLEGEVCCRVCDVKLTEDQWAALKASREAS